ncbi:MAG: tyrosine-type recombinase/integrase, partial [Phycisphaerae bacterium]
VVSERIVVIQNQNHVAAGSIDDLPENKRGNHLKQAARNPENHLHSNLFSNRKRKSRRFKRICNGLFRYKKSGVIYGVFKVQGETVWKNLNTSDRDRAKELMAEEIRKSKRVNLKASHKIRLDELLRFYDTTLENFAPGTSENRRCLIKTFRNSWQHGMDMKVADIRTLHLRTWLAHHRQRLKAHTWNAYLRFLRAVFHLAVEAHVIAENPADGLKLARIDVAPRLTPTWDEFQAIVADIRKQKFNARCKQSTELVEFMGLLGLGQAEVENLRGEHFDFERMQITIVRQKTRKPFVIPIYPQAVELVTQLKAEGRIVTGQTLFNARSPEVALHRACTRLKLPRFSPRSLRRMFIIRALEKGIDPRVVAAWQGHRDATLILRVYGAWVNPDHAQRMAALMA